MMASDENMIESRENNVIPTREELRKRLEGIQGHLTNHGWRVRMRRRFGYVPDEAWYEATVDRLVTNNCSWLDVGGGKCLFANNDRLSKGLSQRCALLVGIDPSENIATNPYVHERAVCTIQQYRSDRLFDLVTMRMVAEHIGQPEPVVESLARLVRFGGTVVVFTPNRWSLVPVVASLTPLSVHKFITRFLWNCKEEDVFPTHYKMNTRRRLRTLFERGGFKETAFKYLDDCSSFQRFRVSCFLELSVWWLLKRFGVRYPQNNLLGVYAKVGP